MNLPKRSRLPGSDAIRTQAPVLTGAQVRAIRTRLGLTRVHLAKLLGYAGAAGSQWLYNIETGQEGKTLSYARANLLLAIAEGYTPVGYLDDDNGAGVTLSAVQQAPEQN